MSIRLPSVPLLDCFEFIKMPFGLRNAGASFQRYMDTLFANVDFVFSCLDDFIIASKDEKDHLEHLDTSISYFIR